MEENPNKDIVIINGIEVSRILGVSLEHFKVLRKQEGFPQPVRPRKRAMYFLEEVREWIKNLPRMPR
jgi:predicted DNA-binding transcriptional regulator AlpA